MVSFFLQYGVQRYTAISRKDVGENVNATIPTGNMGYDQYTVPDDCSCRTYFGCFPLALKNTLPWPFLPILSNFFEEQRTQNHPQCLSGLSRALFPTTFVEIAVYVTNHSPWTSRYLSSWGWSGKPRTMCNSNSNSTPTTLAPIVAHLQIQQIQRAVTALAWWLVKIM